MAFFYLFCALLPFQFALNPAPGIDLASGRVLALALMGWLFIKALTARSFRLSFSPLSVSLFLFLLWTFLSISWSQSLNPAVRTVLLLCNSIPLFWLVDRRPLQDKRIAAVFVYSAGVVALVGIGQFAAQFFIGAESLVAFWSALSPFIYGQGFGASIVAHPSWLVEIAGQTIFRATALFPDPHIFGFYLAFMLPLAFFSKAPFHRWIGIALCGALVLTFSRGAYLGALAALCFVAMEKGYTVMRAKTRRYSIAPLMVGSLAVVMTLSLLLFTPAGPRLASSFDLDEGSNSQRIQNWLQAISLIETHPFVGVGAGNYAYALDPTLEPRSPVYAHNLYLDLWAQLGIIGLLLFLGVMGLALFQSYWSHRLWLTASLIWIMVQSLFDTPLFSAHILPLLTIFFILADRHETS